MTPFPSLSQTVLSISDPKDFAHIHINLSLGRHLGFEVRVSSEASRYSIVPDTL